MINPEKINPFTLPNIPLAKRKELPTISGIYFAIANGKIQYIGRSVNIHQRWISHHRYHEIGEMNDPHIAYLELSDWDEKLMNEIEIALINWFDPPLNGSLTPVTANRKTRLTVTVPLDLKRKFQHLCSIHHRSMSNMVVGLILEAVNKAKKEGKI